jgi:hypothetical protein
MVVSGQLACPCIGEIGNVHHRIVGELLTWGLLSTPAVPYLVQTLVVASLSRYSPVRAEIWQFWQVIYSMTSTFPFTAIGVMQLPTVNHLIFKLSGATTFP